MRFRSERVSHSQGLFIHLKYPLCTRENLYSVPLNPNEKNLLLLSVPTKYIVRSLKRSFLTALHIIVLLGSSKSKVQCQSGQKHMRFLLLCMKKNWMYKIYMFIQYANTFLFLFSHALGYVLTAALFLCSFMFSIQEYMLFLECILYIAMCAGDRGMALKLECISKLVTGKVLWPTHYGSRSVLVNNTWYFVSCKS